MPSSRKFVPPDGGYGWVVVAASFFNLVILAAHFISFSLLYPAITTSLDAEYGVSGWIGSVNQAMTFLPGFAYSTALTKFGGRKTCMTGSLLICIGYVTSAFCTDIPTLYFTYGICAGIGLGLSFLPSLVVLHGYFDKNRGFASGIVLLGFAIGGIVTSIPMQYCIMEFGWRGAMLLYSAISLHIFAFGQLLRSAPTNSDDNSSSSISQVKIASSKHVEECTPIVDANNGKSSKTSYSTIDEESHLNLPTKQQKSVFEDVLDFSLFKNCNFVLYGIATFCFNVGLLTYDMHLISRALKFGIHPDLVAYLPVAEGVGGIFSRLLLSYLSNQKYCDRALVYGVGILFYSILELATTFAVAFKPLMVACVFAGFLNGATFTVQSTVLVDLFGLGRITKSQAMLNTFTGLACFVTTPFAGFLYDITNNYNIPYSIGGSISVIGAVLVIIILIRRDRMKRFTGTYTMIGE